MISVDMYMLQGKVFQLVLVAASVLLLELIASL